MLRQHMGRRFLQDTRTVIAYPASSNAFLRSYSFSFVPSTGPKKRGSRSGARGFLCASHIKNMSNMHRSNLNCLQASWNVSLKKSLVCFPKKSNQSSNRFVKNKVTSIFGPIEDRLYRETKQQKTRSYNICVIIRLFRRKHGAQPNERIFLAKASG